MKKCPYCAEQIQDEAILCRYCHSDLSAAPPGGVNARPATQSSSAPSSTPAATTPSSASPGPTSFGAPSSSSTFAGSSSGPSSFGGSSSTSRDTGSAGSSSGAGSSDTVPSPSSAQSSPPWETPSEKTSESPWTSASDRPSDPEPATTDAGLGSAVAGASAAGATAATSAAADTIVYTHTGHRYVLGYGTDFFGIWDRQTPSAPAERFARSDDGWRQAWTRFYALEPGNAPVDQAETSQPAAAAVPSSAPSSGPTQTETIPTTFASASPAAAPAPAAAQAPAATATSGGEAMQYTHSGQRYLLGYGADFFGIWDRDQLSQPAQRFPRTDEGWRAAWAQFSAWEPNSVDVGIGGN